MALTNGSVDTSAVCLLHSLPGTSRALYEDVLKGCTFNTLWMACVNSPLSKETCYEDYIKM